MTITPPTPDDLTPLPALTLVLGGARSGKSRLAEALVLAHLAKRGGAPARYIATAPAPGDDTEMAARIAAHQTRRGADWTTVEAPGDLTEALTEGPPGSPILLDCLTLWLANLMFADTDPAPHISQLPHLLDQASGPVVAVSNEVGLGIVPDHPLGRTFRDAQGTLNQTIARHAPRTILVTAGLPLILKG
ncbi:bifunctional adenosylcobinamide kinase/adenosylcobinamide-phosphate guanylyltransferase [Roseospirillum parvum]|uniref:Bifunctional adenosylcobalamin biosynthesis protein n=1 Tax=Roseospirillum parvum TaxID=83401 RepID=A0A1G8FYG9_9PROT|nr:bifunctional adenosylcobinamide kinase/adenosylcobinamide-phosphate guanylyltransferase [Roseospirillum parvum]SDH87026.1 adenosylcobinamide kinase / adenosylcobinamide-phosphate guanylyltransferase [Roseospirillum parvum]